MIRKSEIFGILVIIAALIAVTYINYLNSLKRQRDFTRLLDMGNITQALEKYKADYDTYPKSNEDGKIIACFDENTDVVREKGVLITSPSGKWLRVNLVACEWGEDPIESDVYMDRLPKDPKDNSGVRYIYQSDGKDFTLYGAYESRTVSGFDESIKKKGISCGTLICSSAKTSIKH